MKRLYYVALIFIAGALFAGCSTQQASTDLTPLEEEISRQDQQIDMLNNKIQGLQQELTDLQNQPKPEPTPMTDVVIPSGPASQSFKSRYYEALARYEDEHYLDAVRRLEILELERPANDLTDNCRYWIGESYYGMRQFDRAMQSFRDVIKLYPESNKIPDAELMIGKCKYQQGQYDEAMIQLQKVADAYPGTRQRRAALELMNKITNQAN